MNLNRINLLGSSHIGLFAYATDNFCISAPIKDWQRKELEKTLDVPVIETSIAGTSLVGVFITGNSKGIVLPRIVEDTEVRALEKEGIDVLVVEDRCTALGNLLCINDEGGLASPLLSKQTVRQIEEFLNVKIVVLEAKTELVGSSVFANSKAFLASPFLSDKREAIKEALGVPGDFGTVNSGEPFVSAGMIGNSNGILVGKETSPVELTKLLDLFG